MFYFPVHSSTARYFIHKYLVDFVPAQERASCCVYSCGKSIFIIRAQLIHNTVGYARCRKKGGHECVLHYFSSTIWFWWLNASVFVYIGSNCAELSTSNSFAHSQWLCVRVCIHSKREWEREWAQLECFESENFASEMLIYSIQHFCVFRWLGWITSKRLR